MTPYILFIGGILFGSLLHPVRWFKRANRKRRIAALGVIGTLILAGSAAAFLLALITGTGTGTTPNVAATPSTITLPVTVYTKSGGAADGGTVTPLNPCPGKTELLCSSSHSAAGGSGGSYSTDDFDAYEVVVQNNSGSPQVITTASLGPLTMNGATGCDMTAFYVNPDTPGAYPKDYSYFMNVATGGNPDQLVTLPYTVANGAKAVVAAGNIIWNDNGQNQNDCTNPSGTNNLSFTATVS